MIHWIKQSWLNLRYPVYKPYSMPHKFDTNLLVIGAGSAGLVSAYIAQVVGAKVTLVEASKMGGDCLNTGCVPSKTLIHCAKLAFDAEQSSRIGLKLSGEIDFGAVIRQVQQSVTTIEPHDSVERYESLGVEVLRGFARMIDPWRARVTLHSGETRVISARSVVLATGAAPVVPEFSGLEGSGYLTTETLWERFGEFERAPDRLLIVGGGPISCELAQAMARLGSQVTLIERGPRLLNKEDTEVSEFALQLLKDAGVRVLLNTKLSGLSGALKKADLKGGELDSVEYDELLLAVGRQARMKNLGLEALGFDTDQPLEVDEFLRTRYPNLLAAGDVIAPYQFTHTASHEAWYASVNGLFGAIKKFKADYSVIPWTTFMDPEIARVGLSELEAAEQKISVEVTRFNLTQSDRAVSEQSTAGFIKVLAKPGSDQILGALIIAPRAGEMLAEFVLAMKHGLGLKKIMGTIHTYPTWSEAAKSTASNWQQNNKPDWVLKVSKKYHDWMRG